MLPGGLLDRLPRRPAQVRRFLLLSLLPFFVSFVIRILSWQFILADQGIVLGSLKDIGLLPAELPRALDARGGDRRAHLRRPAVHVLPIYVVARDDRPLPRSRPPPTSYAGPLRAFLPRRLAAVAARRSTRGCLLVAITNIGDYVSAAILGGPVDNDDRQHHPDPVRAERQLPGGLGARPGPDGGSPRRRCSSTPAPSAPARSRSTCEVRADAGILGVRALQAPPPAT